MATDQPGGGVSSLSAKASKAVAPLAVVSTLAAVLWSSSLPLHLGVRIYSEQILIAVLCLSIAIAFLTRPATRPRRDSRPAGADETAPPPARAVPWYDGLAAAVALAFGAYLVWRFPTLAENVFYHPVEARIIAAIGLVLLVEAMRRCIGWSLLVILAVICLYALFADKLEGPLQSRAVSPSRLLTFMVLDSASLVGAALYIAVAVVIPFIILAQLLVATGGSAFFSDLSIALMGRRRGGAGKIAILGSAFFGSVSGSAVSNVASTGSITIPLMKSGGYKPKTAGAIEAAASTGGQLMPPIMGAAAFLLAENLQVAYSEVMIAALVPALLFYISLFFFADLEAGRLGIARVEESRIPRLSTVVRRGWFVLAPFVVLIVGLFSFNLRPETAALYAVALLFVLSLFRTYDGTRIGPAVILSVLSRTGRTAVDIVLICAVAGIIIGLFSLSGLSFGLTFFLVQIGNTSLILLLVVTAGICVLLGMGLPTVGVYLLLATLAAPPLIELGLQPMAAHLFVLYFGMLSMITPPVAIAAFVAANMAGAQPMRTGFEAVRIAWPAFIVPFLFAGSPQLMLDGGWMENSIVTLTAVIGVFLVTVGIVGHLNRTLGPAWRGLFMVAGLATLIPHALFDGALIVNLAGIALGAGAAYLTRGGAEVRAPEHP
ncbi:MAG: TRAP transporter permease [Inquilinaceae bacterium]